MISDNGYHNYTETGQLLVTVRVLTGLQHIEALKR